MIGEKEQRYQERGRGHQLLTPELVHSGLSNYTVAAEGQGAELRSFLCRKPAP